MTVFFACSSTFSFQTWWAADHQATYEQVFNYEGGEEVHNMTWTLLSVNSSHFEAEVFSWANATFINNTLNLQLGHVTMTAERASRRIVEANVSDLGENPYWSFWVEPNLTNNTIIRTLYDFNITASREEDLDIMGKTWQCVVTEIDWFVFNMTRWYDKQTGLVVKILSHDMRHAPYHLVITETLIDTTFNIDETDETLQTPWILGLIPIVGLVSILRIRNRRKRKIRDSKSQRMNTLIKFFGLH